MSFLRKLFFNPPVEVPEQQPHKLAERELKDRLIEEQVKANTLARAKTARSARRQTLRYYDSLRSAMDLLGD